MHLCCLRTIYTKGLRCAAYIIIPVLRKLFHFQFSYPDFVLKARTIVRRTISTIVHPTTVEYYDCNLAQVNCDGVNWNFITPATRVTPVGADTQCLQKLFFRFIKRLIIFVTPPK